MTDAERVARTERLLLEAFREARAWVSSDGREGLQAATDLRGWSVSTKSKRIGAGTAPPHDRIGRRDHRLTFALLDLAGWIERHRVDRSLPAASRNLPQLTAFVRPFALLAAIIHGTINTRRVEAMAYRANILPNCMRQRAAARGGRREAHQRIVKLYGNDSYITRAAVGAVSGSDVELAEATMKRNGREGVTARQRAGIAVMPRVLALLLGAAQRKGSLRHFAATRPKHGIAGIRHSVLHEGKPRDLRARK